MYFSHPNMYQVPITLVPGAILTHRYKAMTTSPFSPTKKKPTSSHVADILMVMREKEKEKGGGGDGRN